RKQPELFEEFNTDGFEEVIEELTIPEHKRKKKGRARGLGKRKGTKTARTPKKKAWMKRIRPIRRELKRLRDRKQITRNVYRSLYKKSKGGMFESVAQLKRYIKENDLLKRGR
ncbi:MAG: 50S ribosomal protein L19e, partial [Candidatus Lokiarchaeota archaeon]